ncbi:hypothetical protein BCR42DRAFT_441428 [Absidia repens]|uniref:Uncharacterized protein n=1 Tax=Absidia repens TaxID=90262 RepID=A0A1X2I5T0_9FUNG|nr:hypothetical protein BCR42DRAFT_441428 [Absidia repens]
MLTYRVPELPLYYGTHSRLSSVGCGLCTYGIITGWMFIKWTILIYSINLAQSQISLCMHWVLWQVVVQTGYTLNMGRIPMSLVKFWLRSDLILASSKNMVLNG